MSLTENLPRRPLPERLFWPAIIVLLATMGAMMSIAARLESQTFDEALHLTAGFSYWKTGDFRLNREHPPLSKLLTAFPLLFTAARLPDRRHVCECVRRRRVPMGAGCIPCMRESAIAVVNANKCPTLLIGMPFGDVIRRMDGAE